MSQNDFTIDNDTGQQVRLDMQSSVQALASQSSGATEPTTTYAYMVWADTANDLLKVRNSANSAWVDVYVLSTGVPVAGGGGGSSLTLDFSQTGELTSFDIWMADVSSSPKTRNLPASPTAEDEVIIVDDKGGAATNTITVGRNGKTIMGSATDLTITSTFARIYLKYDASGGDWRIVL